jgi:alpha-L-fucosidase
VVRNDETGRRQFVKSCLAWLTSSQFLVRQAKAQGILLHEPISSGSFKPSWESLRQYRAPEWFRNAKFGIAAHWDPQSVPEDGDWYARNMYIQGSEQYESHLAHYGHPSRFGYKELCRGWKAENWEPERLLETYRSAGARYFVALANHHDGFDCWRSRYQRWNAVNIGPERDVVGTWAECARQKGLRFGVLVFAARNWEWFNVSHGSDKTGPFKGVPYDGNLTERDGKGKWWEGYDPQKLYGPPHPDDEPPPPYYIQNFFDRTKDVIDQYRPDLVFFTDNGLPLGETGLRLAAHYYNSSRLWHRGKVEAVINTKHEQPGMEAALVWDRLPGDAIEPFPWQMDICIGDWHYKRGIVYKTAADVIPYLVDIVSKNGNLLMNIPLRPDGTFDDNERSVLEQIAGWMKINGEAIFDTHPWNRFGEGPTHAPIVDFPFRHVLYTAQDFRFTQKGAILYAIALGWPANGQLTIKSLSRRQAKGWSEIVGVELLGYGGKIRWTRNTNGLTITVPSQPPCQYAYSFRIRFSSLDDRPA